MALAATVAALYVILHQRVDCSTDTSACRHYKLQGGNETTRIDCHQRRLTELPKALFTENVVDLDLSMNTFAVLEADDFKGLAKLVKLNISESGVRRLSADTFAGLTHLEELDMKNNPAIASGLPPALFDRLPRLRRLQISGEVTTGSRLATYGALHGLEEIALTPDTENMPYGLAKLANLKAIYFVHYHGNTRLTRAFLRPFADADVAELAFVKCHLTSIDNDTFDGFSSLKTLNLAGNVDLDFDDVIDALSRSEGLAVSTLILDMVAYNHRRLGFRDHPRCRRAWSHISNLSIRGNGINEVGAKFLRCFSQLSRIAIGFNPFTMTGKHLASISAFSFLPLRHGIYADFSYFRYVNMGVLKEFIGYHQNFILRNADYFKAPLETSTDNGLAENLTTYQPPNADDCIGIGLPPHLKYFRLDHAVMNFGSDLHSQCYRIFTNNVRYIDLSYPYNEKIINVTFSSVVYGFLKLEVLRLAGMQLYDVNMSTFQNCPSLRILDLQSNSFGHGPLRPFLSIPRLQELDFSNNFVATFPNDMFVKLTSLRKLKLSGNALTSLNFDLPEKLECLDISGNRFTSLDYGTRTRLDQLPTVVLDIEENPLQCECTDIEWIEWYQSAETQIRNKQLITCQHHTGRHAIVDADTARLKLDCGLTVNRIVISSVSVALVIFLASAAVVLYRCRWKIRWRYYQLRYRRKNRNDNTMLLTNSNIQHSAYVIYNNENDFSRNWVVRTLVPGAEGNLQKPAMFVKDRDELVGASRVSEVIRGIMTSRTAIWVVCPAFFQCSMCELASHFSISQLGLSNNLCVILENRLELYDDRKELQRLVDPKNGIKCVRFTDNEDGTRLFWDELDAFIPALL